MGDVEILRIIIISAMSLAGLSLISAIAKRIADPTGRRFERKMMALGALGGGVDPAEHEALKDEVAQLKAEVESMRARVADIDELQNRLDFTERVIGQMKHKPALPGASE